MSEVIEKAANINFIADNMINKISELRKQYDAAQATNAASLIYDMENKSKPELRELKNEFEQSIKDLIGELKK